MDVQAHENTGKILLSGTHTEGDTMSGFNFDRAFKEHSSQAMTKISNEIEMLKRRSDEYDQDYFIAYAFSTSLTVCLEVVRHVLEDYDEFLDQENSESQ
ncbi:hypothetical protein ACU1JV_21840 [Paenibacillus sp. T2-29]